jgi:hypothetical protein
MKALEDVLLQGTSSVFFNVSVFHSFGINFVKDHCKENKNHCQTFHILFKIRGRTPYSSLVLFFLLLLVLKTRRTDLSLQRPCLKGELVNLLHTQIIISVIHIQPMLWHLEIRMCTVD